MSARIEKIGVQSEWGSARARRDAATAYLMRNPSLLFGLLMVLSLFAFAAFGRLFVDVSLANPLSAPKSLPPSGDLPFGSDAQGRNLLAVMIEGTWLTIRTGMIAGFLGVIVGSALGLFSAYTGGLVDRVITWAIDVLLTIPAILVLVMVSAIVPGGLSSIGMALIIAGLAWRRPARQIRSQMLVMRSAEYVELARLSGCGPLRIIFCEIAPNLLPFLISAAVTAVAAAILASIGIEAIGLGPQSEPTLGMTVFWLMEYSALLQGMWWWILPPIAILIILFVGLYLINQGVDELSNPRLRSRA